VNIIVGERPDRFIEKLYAWVAVDLATGKEGIMAVSMPGGFSFQAVASNMKTIEMMEPTLRKIAKQENCGMRLVEFGGRKIISV
jgi:hypothetical protein